MGDPISYRIVEKQEGRMFRLRKGRIDGKTIKRLTEEKLTNKRPRKRLEDMMIKYLKMTKENVQIKEAYDRSDTDEVK